jgi:hypothetical protein
MTHDIRHITLDCMGRVYEVTNMFDRNSRPTDEPALASTCVIVFQGEHIEQDAEHIPIYTVH